ncbi:MAG TPA: CesT family type III secretion system chaperone [Magnetospirillum sp.]|nr:CesT family type III secretion system chaperone [Magnetospirillum sp.]
MDRLLEDLCRQMNIDDAATVIASRILVVDELSICIEGRDEIYSEDVLVYTDLGEVAGGNAAEIIRNLLEANLIWAGTGGATIGLHPDTSHAILAYRTPMEGLNGEMLAAAISQFATVAAYWRNFIAEEGRVEGAEVPPGHGIADMMRV